MTQEQYEAHQPLFTGWFKSRKAQRVLDKIEFTLLAQLVDARRIFADEQRNHKDLLRKKANNGSVVVPEARYVESKARVETLESVLNDLNAIKLQVYLGA
ncbi:hypothetical protein SEA_ANAMIKA_56 [Gordonia phage Anamika]|uniref:Uncharacterized protein n=3 Tax=Woesvirus woes TaxID=1982751 RepID=A0A2H4PFY9_9CAUD|nr:hypothetical protein SEA_ANAMIKA_56 [Gordonia phage Anamika]AVP43240.1 hypothetical protein PBI_HAIL2PITT_55 [Gordonia phage Hail2Pitt]QDH48303.1 hypothetical protein SEA_LUKER_57 [Gordonia phage Luker]